KVGHCPVYIMQAGSTPLTWQTNYEYTQTHVGESAFAPNRELFPSMNKTLSDLVTLVRRGVKVPLGYWSAGGTKNIEEDIWQVEKAASVPLDLNEKIEPLFKETMPADATTLLNWESGEVQRGGLSHTAFGELGFRLSGFAINQLQQSLATVITPFAQTLERAYKVISMELIQQYSKGGFPAIKVRGRTSRNQAFGYPQADKIKPSDIKGDWHPEIKLEPTLPKDDAQNFQLAKMARDGEIPLLADETIRAEFLGVRDVDLESEKIAGEWADQLIINRLWKAYLNALADENPMKAQNILAELRRVMMMTGQAGGRQGGGGAMSPTAQAAMGMKGVGMPMGETGVPSSTLPPESLGGLPPGAANAQMPMFSEGEA
ncbi:MAG: hypothetical protein KKD18_06880, partial [Nanoarchaeota archaeon]|nr:hypothetical protein [Nanoarchaeota archaeon]